ncbi:MAG: tetratricopeptide repeat protein [Synechococcales cyanobacterium CRU_2_2]|nr:tetratricopeptide repeat protein [Synechococcales cyanobacterium CRU_2_2]
MRSPQSPQQWNNQLATLQAELADGDRPAALQVGTHVALGQLYYNAANYTQALIHYEDALNLAPHSIEALNGQGNALRHLGRHAEAIVAYDLAINRSPQRAELWTNRGRSGERLGRLREAIADYEHALKLDATRYRLWQRHADLRYRQQRFGAALISYAQALAVQPLKEEEITSQCLFIASPGPYVQRYQAAFSQLDLRLEKR